MDQQEALARIDTVQAGRFEGGEVEVKAAHHGVPQRLYDTLSAFANHTAGGVVILGLDEEEGFAPVGLADPQQTLAEVGDQASRMEPPIRLNPVVVSVDDRAVAVFEVLECDYRRKPCYYSVAGLKGGSYIRVGNSNRQMSDYEIFTYLSARGQPTFDRDPVEDAGLDALDRDRVGGYLQQVRREKPRLWRRLRLDDKTFAERLCDMDIVVRSNGDYRPTVAGLLVFGLWPQKTFPSLTITFVRYQGSAPGMPGPRGERFLDNRKFEGRLDEMVDDAVQRVTANMRQGTLIDGIFHRTVFEYPEEAVREAIINAVAHRDYSPHARGTHVRVEMYADRLEVITPGGLHGPVSEENLEDEVTTRNQLLMRLLEETGLVENRGSGIPMMIAAMREAHLEPPLFRDSRTSFRVIFKNHTLLDPETLNWLNQFASYPLSDAQRTGLAYLRSNRRLTNSDYRRVNNATTVEATQELRAMVNLGLIKMHGTRRWAYYTLTQEKEHGRELWTRPARLILDYVDRHGSITNRKCRELLGWGEQERGKAYRLLKSLVEQGELRPKGHGRGAHYMRP